MAAGSESEKSRRGNSSSSAKQGEAQPKSSKGPKTFLGTLREWTDAIIIAYVLAMFIRTFVVELFKIPSGSMTPTLVGDYAAEIDWNDDGKRDLLVTGDPPQGAVNEYQIFLSNDDHWTYEGKRMLPNEKILSMGWEQVHNPLQRWAYSVLHWSPIHRRNDKIFVNKFAFWFKRPDRGDLVVFKVPKAIWSDLRPIYIKRAVGFAGENVTLTQTPDAPLDKGRLTINGQVVDQPSVFRTRYYAWAVDLRNNPPFWTGKNSPSEEDKAPWENQYANNYRFLGSHVPDGCLLAFGDNTERSYDGRYWGAIPLENLKGKAFFRYSPLSKIGFLH